MGLNSSAIGKLTLSSGLKKPADAAGITTTSVFVMLGYGAVTANTPVFTPKQSGNILVIFKCLLGSGTTGDGATANLVWGTGTAPANAAAAAGTVIDGPITATALTGILYQWVTFVGFITGATLNTQIWVDIQIKAVTGGTALAKSCIVSFIELPA